MESRIMNSMKAGFSKTKIGEVIDKTESWFDNQVTIKGRLPKWIIEALASFAIIFLIGIPLAYSKAGSEEIRSAAEYINKTYFVRALYLALIFLVTFAFFRKFKVTGAPLGLTYAWAAKNINWKEFIIRLAWQLGGGLLATFILFQISFATDSFVAMDVSSVNPDEWVLGTGLGSPKPFIRGWYLTPVGSQGFHREYWFYAVRMGIEILMIVIGMVGMFYFRKYKLRGHVIGRFLLQFVIVMVSLKFQAHSANIIRFTSGIIMASHYGGYHDWHLYGFVLSGHAFALAGMWTLVRSPKVMVLN